MHTMSNDSLDQALVAVGPTELPPPLLRHAREHARCWCLRLEPRLHEALVLVPFKLGLDLRRGVWWFLMSAERAKYAHVCVLAGVEAVLELRISRRLPGDVRAGRGSHTCGQRGRRKSPHQSGSPKWSMAKSGMKRYVANLNTSTAVSSSPHSRQLTICAHVDPRDEERGRRSEMRQWPRC